MAPQKQRTRARPGIRNKAQRKANLGERIPRLGIRQPGKKRDRLGDQRIRRAMPGRKA
jgi:hypothetical protein